MPCAGAMMWVSCGVVLNVSPIRQKYRHHQKCITSQIKILPPIKSKKRDIIYKKAAIFIFSYKSQLSIGNLNDYRLHAIATMENLH